MLILLLKPFCSTDGHAEMKLMRKCNVCRYEYKVTGNHEDPAGREHGECLSQDVRLIVAGIVSEQPQLLVFCIEACVAHNPAAPVLVALQSIAAREARAARAARATSLCPTLMQA